MEGLIFGILRYSLNYSGTRFLYTEIKITQFPGGLRLNPRQSLNPSGRHPLPMFLINGIVQSKSN